MIENADMREVFDRLRKRFASKQKPEPIVVPKTCTEVPKRKFWQHPGFCDKCWVEHVPANCPKPEPGYYESRIEDWQKEVVANGGYPKFREDLPT